MGWNGGRLFKRNGTAIARRSNSAIRSDESPDESTYGARRGRPAEGSGLAVDSHGVPIAALPSHRSGGRSPDDGRLPAAASDATRGDSFERTGNAGRVSVLLPGHVCLCTAFRDSDPVDYACGARE